MVQRNNSILSAPENIAAAACDDGFCEEVAVQSIVDVQSYRIAAHIASKFLCRSTSDFFYSLNVRGGTRGCAYPATLSTTRLRLACNPCWIIQPFPLLWPREPPPVFPF